MTNKNQRLSIVGDTDNIDLKQLQNTSQVNITLLDKKSHTANEFIKVVFQDFSIISFTRDLIISSIISIAYSEIKDTLQLLLKNNKNIQELSFHYKIQLNNGNSAIITVISHPGKINKIINMIDFAIEQNNLRDTPYLSEAVITLDENDNITINAI